jgi:hypothetical protein
VLLLQATLPPCWEPENGRARSTRAGDQRAGRPSVTNPARHPPRRARSVEIRKSGSAGLGPVGLLWRTRAPSQIDKRNCVFKNSTTSMKSCFASSTPATSVNFALDLLKARGTTQSMATDDTINGSSKTPQLHQHQWHLQTSPWIC